MESAVDEYGGTLVPALSKWSYFAAIAGNPNEPEAGPYTPHEGQLGFHESNARFRIMSGGARGGKSRAASVDVGPLILTPGTKGWIVAPNYELGSFIFDYIVRDLKHLGVKFHRLERSVTQGRLYAEILDEDTGLTSMFRVKSGSPGHQEGLLGEELDWVIMEEASRLKENVWTEFIRTRLRSRGGIAIFVSSPHRFNWFRDLTLAAVNDPEWSVHWNDSNLNPGNAERELTVKDLGGDEKNFMEQVLGIATSDEGLVWEEFKPEKHVMDCTKRPHLRDLPVICGVDFGYKDPTVCLWIAVEGKGKDMKFYVLQEYSKSKRRYPKHATVIKSLGRRSPYQPVEYYVCDSNNPAAIRDFKDAGMFCKKARKEVEAGLDAIGQLFEEEKLFIDKSCKELIKDLQRYEMGDNDKPRHDYSHAPDALRYGIFFVFKRGGVY